VISKFKAYLGKPVHIAPLVVFRIAFGLLMFASTIRFISKGWVQSLYVDPKVFFPFYGFEWVKPLGETGMYIVFGAMALLSLFIAFGLFFRLSTLLFFIAFTYVELIDKTNYLNHYYFISITAFLLQFLPAHHYFSLDTSIFKIPQKKMVANSALFILKLQVAIVYFFAGVAKINPDWLMDAMPLKIWLRAFTHLPLIGRFMEDTWLAFLFSWFGCIYDLCIPFFLFNPKTAGKAYYFVIIFHVFTAIFFNIGMFPYIMIVITCIFLKESFHLKLLSFFERVFGKKEEVNLESGIPFAKISPVVKTIFIAHFIVQVLLPFRYTLYSGDLFWTEQGYRFSWRVMLMEKAGTAFFYVKDKKLNREVEVQSCDYLTPFQQKMVATQPDMILDFAHFLKKEYAKKGFNDPSVRVEAYVTLNGSPSRLMIDPKADLTLYSNNFAEKKWILSAE
jgi:hypothetical protein